MRMAICSGVISASVGIVQIPARTLTKLSESAGSMVDVGLRIRHTAHAAAAAAKDAVAGAAIKIPSRSAVKRAAQVINARALVAWTICIPSSLCGRDDAIYAHFTISLFAAPRNACYLLAWAQVARINMVVAKNNNT